MVRLARRITYSIQSFTGLSGLSLALTEPAANGKLFFIGYVMGEELNPLVPKGAATIVAAIPVL